MRHLQAIRNQKEQEHREKVRSLLIRLDQMPEYENLAFHYQNLRDGLAKAFRESFEIDAMSLDDSATYSDIRSDLRSMIDTIRREELDLLESAAEMNEEYSKEQV